MKRLAPTIAVALMLIEGSALAQLDHSMQPGAMDQAGETSPEGLPAPGAGTFSNASANDVMASDVVGSPVSNREGDRIGEVEDVLITQDGQVDGLVISVGEFLGIGGRSVGVHMERLQISRRESDGIDIVVSMTRDELADAPEYGAASPVGDPGIKDPDVVPGTGLGTAGTGTAGGFSR